MAQQARDLPRPDRRQTGKVRVPEGQIANFVELPNTTDWLVEGASGQVSWFLVGRRLTYQSW